VNDDRERKQKLVLFSANDPRIANVDIHNIARWSRRPQQRSTTLNVSAYDAKNPYLAKIIVNRELHSPQSNRSCRHIEIHVPPEFLKYYWTSPTIFAFSEKNFNKINTLLLICFFFCCDFLSQIWTWRSYRNLSTKRFWYSGTTRKTTRCWFESNHCNVSFGKFDSNCGSVYSPCCIVTILRHLHTSTVHTHPHTKSTLLYLSVLSLFRFLICISSYCFVFYLYLLIRKPILKMLASYATDSTEKEKLLKIASEDPADSVQTHSHSSTLFSLLHTNISNFRTHSIEMNYKKKVTSPLYRNITMSSSMRLKEQYSKCWMRFPVWSRL
jgi:hypothetical protein